MLPIKPDVVRWFFKVLALVSFLLLGLIISGPGFAYASAEIQFINGWDATPHAAHIQLTTGGFAGYVWLGRGESITVSAPANAVDDYAYLGFYDYGGYITTHLQDGKRYTFVASDSGGLLWYSSDIPGASSSGGSSGPPDMDDATAVIGWKGFTAGLLLVVIPALIWLPMLVLKRGVKLTNE